MKRLVICALMACLLALVWPGSVIAQEDSGLEQRDQAFEEEIYTRLRVINPEAVPIFAEATRSMDAGDFEKARAGFNEVLELAPDFPDALRRLSYNDLALGDLEAGLQHAQRAYDLDPSPYNRTQLADALLQQGTPAQNFEAFRHAQAAAAALPDDPFVQTILLFTADATENYEVVRQAATKLKALQPDNPIGYIYLGIAEAVDGRWEKAEKEILLSQELGMPAEIVKEVLDSGIASQARLYRLARWGVYAFLGWLGSLILLFGIGSVLSGLTLKAIRQPRPESQFEGGGMGKYQTSRSEQALRRVYQVVIALTSGYFYLSIPLLILLMVVIVAGIFYLFLVIGTIPIRLAGFIGLMALYTLYAILRSLFTRRRDVEPGQPLTRQEAPGLWSLTERVAAHLDTRPVDAIYITPGSDIAVVERGGMLKKLRGAGQRCLILGLGVLNGMSQGQFQAILAHEYGHFSNRDTAGGNLANQVLASLVHLAFRLGATGQAHWFNPVWLFVNGYYRTYRRVTLGASRLQEILADRYAVIAYGVKDFVAGLTHVIRQSVNFEMQADLEIQSGVEASRPINNLYQLPPIETDQSKDEFDQKVKEVLERPTSPYDSHPSYQDRVRYVQELRGVFQGEGNPAPASDLFQDIALLQEKMTAVVQENINKRRE